MPCLPLWRPVAVGRSGNGRRYTAHTQGLETTGQTGSWCKPTQPQQNKNINDLVRSHLQRHWPAHKTAPQTQAGFCSLDCSLPFGRWCWPDVPRCTQVPQIKGWKIFREFGGQEIVAKPLGRPGNLWLDTARFTSFSVSSQVIWNLTVYLFLQICLWHSNLILLLTTSAWVPTSATLHCSSQALFPRL